MTTWNLNTPPDETRDALDLAERRLAAHAVAWVTAAERLGLEIREEEPEATRARVLAYLAPKAQRVLERASIVAWLRGRAARGIWSWAGTVLRYAAAAIERGEHLTGGADR